MKILTPQEEREQMAAVWRGGTLGFTGGLALGVAGVLVASRRSAGFRTLSGPFRAFLACSSATFAGVISADRASRKVAEARHSDTNYKNISERNEAEYAKTKGTPLWERTKQFVSRERYPIVYGSWAASMGIAFLLVNRNRFLTSQQKLVQARVYAQGLTLAVLVASFALEGNDMRAGKGRWETVKVIDPAGSGKMVEKRIHHEAYAGEDQWMDMIESQEEKMRKAGHRVSSKEDKTKAESQAKERGEPLNQSKGVRRPEQEQEAKRKQDGEAHA